MTLVATDLEIHLRPATADAAQARYDRRMCVEDHPSVRCGGDDWQIITCSECEHETAYVAVDLAEAA